MAYTPQELDAAKAARLALINGERVASVSAGNRTVQYSQTDLDKLDRLIDKMESALSSGSGRRRFVLTTTSKGL